MSWAVVVRYRMREDAVDENIALVQAVYEELATTRPVGLRYSTFRVEERTFVHAAVIEGTENPLDHVVAFQKFTAGIGERCEEGPQATAGELVGTYPVD